MNDNTVLTFKHNGVTYRKVFAGRVSYGTVERYLIMERHIGISAHREAIVSLIGLL
jgi:hypothetical protein